MTIHKAALFAGAVYFTAVGTTCAIAQTQPAGPAQPPNKPPPSSDVIVTGTRIPRPNLEQPTQVSVVSQKIIQNAGTPDLGQVIQTLPSMGPNGSMRANVFEINVNLTGLSFADLRSLGANRTLTLVDGQRHVAADPGSFAVDLGSISPALVDRVEVVTGGASAIYGSDALAGVVNIITKTRFIGVEGEIQGAYYPHGNYGQNESGYLSVGRNFAGDRGNVNATLFWDNNAEVMGDQVPALHNYGEIVNPFFGTDPFAAPTPTPGVPEFLVARNVESEYINNTGVLVNNENFTAPTTFTADGTPIPQQQRIATNSAPFGAFEPNCATCFQTEQFEPIEAKSDRIGGDVRLYYEITPHLNFSVDEKLVQREIYASAEPSICFFCYALTPDNAFITPAIAAAAAAQQPAFSDGQLFVDRFLTDAGVSKDYERRITERVVPKLSGDFDAKFAQINWDTSFNFGESDNWFSNRDGEIVGNFNAAIDSVIDPGTNMPACRVNVPSAQPPGYTPPAGMIGPASSCIPYNPFGNQNSQAAINYFRVTTWENQRLYQEVADFNVNFNTSRFWNLQGGPISVAAGVEWRKERVVDDQDPLIINGLTASAPTPNFAGGFEVSEAYVEVNVPIFKHRGFLLDELSIDAADRNAQYTTVGNVNAWKISGVYGPIPGFKFRGDYSISVRAPNLTEAFLPPSGNFFSLEAGDPCSNENITATTNRLANCTTLLTALGLVPGVFNDSAVNLSQPGITVGNPKLTPEQSTSYTVGFILQPTFAKTFSLTVDYYNIDIKNAILQPSGQQIVNNCVDGPSLNPVFCNLIQRAPVDGFVNQDGQVENKGDISFLTQSFVNASRLFTDGVEVQATYGFRVDPRRFRLGQSSDLPGQVTFSLDYNYLMHLHDFPFLTSPNQYNVSEGAVGNPYQRARADITYDQGPLSVTWTLRYVGKSADFNRSPGQSAYATDFISPAYFPSELYNDVVVHYRMPVRKAMVDFYVGAQDLFNVQPPPNAITGNVGGPDGSALYDLGVYVFAGARMKY